MEYWKGIKDYEGLYQISNLGRVKSLRKWCGNKHLQKWVNEETIMKPTDNGKGYLIVSLRKNGKRKNFYIHRLVASYFIDKPNDKNVINHKDYNTKNNNADNLEWVTIKENINYSKQNMHTRKPRKTNTGEIYITYRKQTRKYRVVFDKKEYSYSDMESAIKKRDELIKEDKKNGEINNK